MKRKLTPFAAVVLLTLPVGILNAFCSEVWVDNLVGNDSDSGSQTAPFRSVARAVRDLKPGMTLHLHPTSKPYPADIRIEVSGTSELPIVIDGHGSLVSGMCRLPSAQWKAEGGDVFSRPLPNNAWGMAHYWEGGFELVRFAGKPGRNVTSRDALEPGTYFLYKNQKELKTDTRHNTLFIRLPAGKTPDDEVVECIAASGGVYVGGSFVTVRNLICEFAGDDGFATVRCKGVVFENVESRFNMDQGMSHHGSEVVVRNGFFHHNAGCGIVDVYPEAKIRYEHCLIESDTWRGGVEFLHGDFEMVDCVIRANPKKALKVTKGAHVTLRNCLMIAPEIGATTGLSFDDGKLEVSNCTFYGFAVGLDARVSSTNRIEISHCAWLRCKLNSRIQNSMETQIITSNRLHFAGNYYEPAPWEAFISQPSTGGGKQPSCRIFTAKEHAGFATQVGTDVDAMIASLDAATDPLSLPALHTVAGDSVGAKIPQPFIVGVTNRLDSNRKASSGEKL